MFTNPKSPFARGANDCAQDYCENAPFGCVGGLDARAAMVAPPWVALADVDEYLRGYATAARDLFGDDWQTVTFGWTPALTIGGEPDHKPDCPCAECCPDDLCPLCASAACSMPGECM